MRSFLSLLALVMFVGVIGCNEAAPEGGTAPATENTEDGDTASTETAAKMTEVTLNLPGVS